MEQTILSGPEELTCAACIEPLLVEGRIDRVARAAEGDPQGDIA